MFINGEFIPRWQLMVEADTDPGDGGGGSPPPADPPADPPPADPPADDPPPAAATKWPDDWRSQMAGGDEKAAAQLERFTDPGAVGKSFFEGRARIAAGDVLKPLAEDASAEDIAAFREQQGIPEKAKDYLNNMPDGLVVGEDDKPAFESFAEHMHSKNIPPGVVHEAMGWYNDLLDKQNAEVLELDSADKESFEDTMREEWGADYRANLNVVNSLLDANFPEGVVEMLKNGRGADGKALFNNQDFMRGLVGMGRMMNPLSTVLPAGEDNAKGLAEEKAEIEKLMKENRPAYDKDEKMQARYRDLIQAGLDQKARAAA